MVGVFTLFPREPLVKHLAAQPCRLGTKAEGPVPCRGDQALFLGRWESSSGECWARAPGSAPCVGEGGAGPRGLFPPHRCGRTAPIMWLRVLRRPASDWCLLYKHPDFTVGFLPNPENRGAGPARGPPPSQTGNRPTHRSWAQSGNPVKKD